MLTTTQQDGNLLQATFADPDSHGNHFQVMSHYFLLLLQVWIFNYNDDHSREIYHTKSMQRFVSIIFFSLYLAYFVYLILNPKFKMVPNLYTIEQGCRRTVSICPQSNNCTNLHYINNRVSVYVSSVCTPLMGILLLVQPVSSTIGNYVQEGDMVVNLSSIKTNMHADNGLSIPQLHHVLTKNPFT